MDSANSDIIKTFISLVKEYNHQKSEAVSQKLQRCLQILSTISDSNIFDPNNPDGPEFFVSLYDLMSTLDSRLGLTWCAISVLEEALKNPAAHYALIHRFKFTPVLTQLLSGHLILDKQLKILRLLQEFTYGVKLMWQDAHLPLLVEILIKWIKSNDRGCELLVSLSLGVLVNICYKNLPAVYVLRRSIDTKELMKSILSRGKDNLDIRVQAYKMLIILEEVSGEFSENEILPCVKWTFKRMYEAFEIENVNAMRHVIDFFKDMEKNKNFQNALLNYTSYLDDTEKLLSLLEGTNRLGTKNECITLMLEFIECVITFQGSNLVQLFRPMVSLALNLIDETNPQINQTALHVISTTLFQMKRHEEGVCMPILNELDKALPMLLSLLTTHDDSRDVKCSIAALMGLLLELSEDASICAKISNSLQLMTMRNQFLKILSSDTQEVDNIFDELVTSFYLQGLSLISVLSSHRTEWKELLSELLQQKKLKTKLAALLYTGSAEVKQQIFKLIISLGTEHRLLNDLPHCMTELHPLLVPFANVVQNGDGISQKNNLNATLYAAPLLSVAQQNRLDQCIGSVQEAVNNNQVGGVGTSAMLELYEYRVAAMRHTESVLQGNLQAVENYSIQLRHRLSIMTSEINKLLTMLNSKVQSIEEYKFTITNLENNLFQNEELHKNKLSQVIQELENKNVKIEDLRNDVNKSKHQITILKDRIQELEKDLEVQEVLKRDNDTLKLELRSKEETIQQKLNEYEKKCKEAQEFMVAIQNREKTIEQQNTLIKGLEKSMREKEIEITQQQKEIAELQEMRDVIMKVTMEKSNTDRHAKRK